MSQIEINASFQQVLNFINQTAQTVFLTGKAGTGKTTLLKYIRENTFKQISVVAPTGVAAINAGGSTIHSFFQFPFSPFIPAVNENNEIDYPKTNLSALKFTASRLQIFRKLELLVIDEISMVRSDMLDQIDICLRHTRKKWHLPFGGVQLLLIGDLFQLPPVVRHEEWALLKSIYKSPFFFDSFVIRKNLPVYIELDKIYRQSEQTFIGLLNMVRNNQLDQSALNVLNSRFKADLTEKDYSNNITLTTHNHKADKINSENLKSLEGKQYSFKCKLEGNFNEKNYPVDPELILKKGARVMFLKNNSEKNYYNGKIGIVSYIDKDKIKVKCEDDRNEIVVEREVWSNVSYSVDKNSKRISEEILGQFIQYPLRTAWAITIHKSQGLTFDKLIIDAAESFSAGQVYVALSRCRSLEGLTLSSRINSNCLINDSAVVNFSEARPNHDQLQTIYLNARRTFISSMLLELFDFSEMAFKRGELAGSIQMYKSRFNAEGITWASNFFNQIDTLADVSKKFIHQLTGLLVKIQDIELDNVVQERIKKAALYYQEHIDVMVSGLKDCPIRTESKEAAEPVNADLQSVYEDLIYKQELIKVCLNGFNWAMFIAKKLAIVYPVQKLNVYANARNTKVNADVKYPDLFRKLMLLRDEICNEEQMPVYLVASSKTITELSNYLPLNETHLLQISGFGKAKTEAYGARFLEIIKEYVQEHGLETSMDQINGSPNKTTKQKSKSSDKVSDKKLTSEKVNTKEQTFRLFKQGLTPEEIAIQRGFTLSTIEGHLIPYIANGEINVDHLVAPEKKTQILNALEHFTYEAGLNSVKNSLPQNISFMEIRYVLADKIQKTGTEEKSSV